MRAFRRLVITVSALCLVTAGPSAQDKTFAVGKLGACVELGKQWQSDKSDGRERFDGSEQPRLFGRARR